MRCCVYKHHNSYLHNYTYRIAGIFRGVIFSWFSWSRGEPRNICTRKSANRVAYRVRAPKTTKFFPQNSQNYDFHENITPRKIPAIRYITCHTKQTPIAICNSPLHHSYCSIIVLTSLTRTASSLTLTAH